MENPNGTPISNPTPQSNPSDTRPLRSLPGFREFYPEETAERNYLFAIWRHVARRYGFLEIDGPVLEPLELYAKKNESGAEILEQLYRFTDKGGRENVLRPEMTPTLARMVLAKEKQYRKPIRWFSIANFFRYERPQKGRLREFAQLNCDLIGDASPAADAELIALTIDILRQLGFTREDVVVRISSRQAWLDFLTQQGCSQETAAQVLQIVDKLEREPEESLNAKLAPYGLSVEVLRTFIASGSPTTFAPLLQDLTAREMAPFVEIDLSIVRGLAYYTGLVFEIFDRRKSLRALAGGGRYDNLLADLSDNAVSLPAIGFGLGDVSLMNLIHNTPHAKDQMETLLAKDALYDVFFVIADEAHRPEALNLISMLRSGGYKVGFVLGPTKVGKQFQMAEQAKATLAFIIGSEWPKIKIKNLETREEHVLEYPDYDELVEKFRERFRRQEIERKQKL